MKAIYLVKSDGYSYHYADGSKRTENRTINYHCYESLEKAEEFVRKWQIKQNEDNKRNTKKGKIQVWRNYKIEILYLY